MEKLKIKDEDGYIHFVTYSDNNAFFDISSSNKIISFEGCTILGDKRIVKITIGTGWYSSQKDCLYLVEEDLEDSSFFVLCKNKNNMILKQECEIVVDCISTEHSKEEQIIERIQTYIDSNPSAFEIFAYIFPEYFYKSSYELFPNKEDRNEALRISVKLLYLMNNDVKLSEEYHNFFEEFSKWALNKYKK